MAETVAREVEIDIDIRGVSAQKKDDTVNHNSEVVFGFNVNMEESERKSESISLSFQMTMDTEPPIAKFTIEGVATLKGEISEVEKLLSPDQQTNVPIIFTRIYKQVYSILFLLAGSLDIPTPSPALMKGTSIVAATARPAK